VQDKFELIFFSRWVELCITAKQDE
jgi:hypothetical protein